MQIRVKCCCGAELEVRAILGGRAEAVYENFVLVHQCCSSGKPKEPLDDGEQKQEAMPK